MSDPTLTITLDRTSLGLGALVLSGSGTANPLGIVAYTPPALQQRIIYAPDAPGVHGSEALAASWQQAVLGFDWCRFDAATEAQVAASYDEVAEALGQFSFLVTTAVSDALAQTWAANAGSLVPSARTYSDLTYRNPVYAVSIPVYPIPS